MSTKRDKICAEILQVESNYVRALRTLEQEIRVPVMYVFFIGFHTSHLFNKSEILKTTFIYTCFYTLLFLVTHSLKFTSSLSSNHTILRNARTTQGAIRTQDASQVEFHIRKHENYSGSQSEFAFGSARGR